MMTKPGITELDRCVDSRYTLVSMAAKRARMIGAERNKAELASTEKVNVALEKTVTQAVCEISEGIVGYVRSTAVDRAMAYEEEKIHAITQLQAEPAAEESDEAAADTEAE